MIHKSKKIIAVVGPTASGKSDLAVEIALKTNGEIISADSRQVYKELDIGTGKITKKEMRGVPHFMLDIASPKKRFNAAEYRKKAGKALSDILARGNTPILCGGTGFYISALVEPSEFPDVPPNENLRKRLNRLAVEKLFAELRKKDPERASCIDPKNKRRIIRALEIVRALGKVPKMTDAFTKKNDLSILWIGTALDKKRLREKISIRLGRRLKEGMIAETKRLHQKGLSWKRMEELGLEYKYLALFFAKEDV